MVPRISALHRFSVALAIILGVAPAGAVPDQVHVVAEGQSLGKIARRYGTTVAAIRTANSLDRGKPLQIGQELLIPGKDEPGSPRQAEPPTAEAPSPKSPTGSVVPRVHEVASGQTLEKIARRYDSTVEALCTANAFDRDTVLQVGQKLVVPGVGDTDGSLAARARPQLLGPEESPQASGGAVSTGRSSDGLQVLDVPGAPPAFYYEPSGAGRLGPRPVVVYLHGRGGDPRGDCQKWAAVARPRGWLLCPSGQEDRGGGARGWNNDWPGGNQVVMKVISGLRAKYGRRVQNFGNTLIGFSEGAYVAMNVGVREPRVFNRWLILAASEAYWGMAGHQALEQARHTVRRVYLITGALDGVVESSRSVLADLQRSNISVRFVSPEDMGHEVALRNRPYMYTSALLWLERG